MPISDMIARKEKKLFIWTEEYLYGRFRWLGWVFIVILLSPIVWAFNATR